MKHLFKICSCCGKEFKTKEAFIAECSFVGPWHEFGLDLYNCECNSTLSIELYEGSKEDSKKARQQRNKEGLE